MIFTPATINFTLRNGTAIYKNSHWHVEISIANKEGEVTTPINLLGYTGVCQIRKTLAPNNTFSVSPIITIIDADTGTFVIDLDDSETAKIPTTGVSFEQVDRYLYEVQLIDENQNSYRILHGYVEVSPSAIRN